MNITHTTVCQNYHSACCYAVLCWLFVAPWCWRNAVIPTVCCTTAHGGNDSKAAWLETAWCLYHFFHLVRQSWCQHKSSTAEQQNCLKLCVHSNMNLPPLHAITVPLLLQASLGNEVWILNKGLINMSRKHFTHKFQHFYWIHLRWQ